MSLKHFLLTIFLNIYLINASLIFWSNKKLEVSPLLPFDDEDLENLVETLENPKVFLFKVTLKNRNTVIPSNLRDVMKGFYSSYNPNGNIGTLKAIELFLSEDCNGIDTSTIQKTMGRLTNSTNFLSVVDITYGRQKRSVPDESPTTDNPKSVKNFTPKGAVIYIGQNKRDDLYALLYSSNPLMLEISNTTIKYLGNTDNSLITVDKRLNIPIPLEEKEKVTLRFDISWINGYWYLQTVKIELIDSSSDILTYDLATDENIMAPAHFSYHCNGKSVFTDPSSGTTLTIYDLQVQLDSRNRKFGDANDCVPFTTAPIWSGLFVATILGLGLIVALIALFDIKTMDKFDNYKTRNLAITVFE